MNDNAIDQKKKKNSDSQHTDLVSSIVNGQQKWVYVNMSVQKVSTTHKSQSINHISMLWNIVEELLYIFSWSVL